MTDLVEQYQAETIRLADGSAVTVAALLVALQAGEITTTEFEELLAGAVGLAIAAAATLADAYVSAHIEQVTSAPTPAVGVPPMDDRGRLIVAARTILDDTEVDPAPRFERLARAEPLVAAQRHAVAVMTRQPAVTGWRLRLDSDACELCRWYAADGRVYSVSRPFKQPHPGCNCQPEPVTRKDAP